MSETYKIIARSEEETIELAQNIESEKFPNMVICLRGDLGSGKTVFIPTPPSPSYSGRWPMSLPA